MITRRQLLGSGVGLAIASMLERAAIADEPQKIKGKAKNVILLWMNGGPSHIDTWDPKQGKVAGRGICR